MTQLAEKLADRIRANGPITVADYMAACLGDREHGYYLHREPFGRRGDFVTAPEVSQMFGELVGIWTVLTWEAMGRPKPFALAELGPGRGSLMVDLLRASRVRPAFEAAAQVHLVETSPRLRAEQRSVLSDFRAAAEWHDSVDSLPAEALIVIANEFFDALPIRQHIRVSGGWSERMVGLDDSGRLAFGLRPTAAPPINADGDLIVADGGIVETSSAAPAIIHTIAERLAAHGGAALIIDYGYQGPAAADTLQAVRRHRYDDPLAAPGEADLTAHVDFTVLSKTAEAAGAAPRPLIEQGAFLGGMGLASRAASLAMGKTADVQDALRSAADQLAGPDAMGTLFKVLALSQPGLALPLFDGDDSPLRWSGMSNA
ncbi:MAG: class I SAM-dependent methyltransferase [Hyphomicrobiales bacterium]|nr:class I SAM-dependent methyltransferase [Hyphomicrobiales bacterium]